MTTALTPHPLVAGGARAGGERAPETKNPRAGGRGCSAGVLVQPLDATG